MEDKLKFVLFKNEYKQSDNHPDYQISKKIDVGGNKEYQSIATAYKNTSKNGKEYLSMTVDLELLREYLDNQPEYKPKEKQDQLEVQEETQPDVQEDVQIDPSNLPF